MLVEGEVVAVEELVDGDVVVRSDVLPERDVPIAPDDLPVAEPLKLSEAL